MSPRPSRVVVLDYGSGNVRSVVQMLERVGAEVELTADPDLVARAEGLYLPGVGNFHACMQGLIACDGPRLVRDRIAAGSPVLGVCVGMQVLFADSVEPSALGNEPGLGYFPGVIRRLTGPVVPHMGWAQVQPPSDTTLFAGVEQERFYFVHSYAAHDAPTGAAVPAKVTWTEHGDRFVAAVENGVVNATQFHPEKSGDAGAQLVRNWLSTL